MFRNNPVVLGALAQTVPEVVFRPAGFAAAPPSGNADTIKGDSGNIPYDEVLNQIEQLNKLLSSILSEMKSGDGL
jgi:hypothetical protein